MQRRTFLAGLAGCALLPDTTPRRAGAQDAIDFDLPRGERQIVRVPALHYEKLPGKKVICHLCPRECRVADQERGYCGVRENIDGEYFTLAHGRIAALNVDPIEKKPFFHVLPGTQALSLATAGCNMECRFCQNWQISQFRPEQVDSHPAPPESIFQAARRRGARSVAYTYSEPTIFYEYMLEIARTAQPRGLHNLVVSNGYINAAPLEELAPHLSAYKVDLKAFTASFYREQCSAELEPVLATLRLLKRLALWTEIVILIIPTLNDDTASNREMFTYIATELGPDIPVHLSRFHPTYKIQNLPRTPVATLERLYELARAAGLNFVYLGNVPGHRAESTYCPNCGHCVIERHGYVVGRIDLAAGRCGACDTPIPGVWS